MQDLQNAQGAKSLDVCMPFNHPGNNQGGLQGLLKNLFLNKTKLLIDYSKEVHSHRKADTWAHLPPPGTHAAHRSLVFAGNLETAGVLTLVPETACFMAEGISF